MRLLAWIRASQAVLFEASIVPACVGSAAAIAAGASFNGISFALILASLVGIQAGANLLKGYYEALDRAGAADSTGSWIAFDSGAAVGLTEDPRSVVRVAWIFLGVGVIAGLVLVLLTRSPTLLAFGIAGFLLAWSYSSPPLRLSFRGIGEFSTFLAFGPIMTVGATVAFGGAGWEESLVASLVLGFLAASISFARYFPNADEDRGKGKRTPVTILGPRPAAALLLGLLWGALGTVSVWFAANPRYLYAWLLTTPFTVGATLALPSAIAGRAGYGPTIGFVVLAHLLAGTGLVLSFLL